MYKKILIPIAPDHIDAIRESIDVARILSSEGASIHALSVVEVVPYYAATELPYGLYERTCADMEKKLKAAFDDLSDVSIGADTGHAPSKIIDVATEGGYDLIVIRSHKPGLQDWFLGSTAGRVLRHAPCAVHVLR